MWAVIIGERRATRRSERSKFEVRERVEVRACRMSLETSSGKVEAEETLEYQLVIKSRCTWERRVSRPADIAGEGGYRGGGVVGAGADLTAATSADQRVGLVKAREGRERRVVSKASVLVGSVVNRRRARIPTAESVIPVKKAQTIKRKLGSEVVATWLRIPRSSSPTAISGILWFV